jgi:polyvinyl alcohol dehydrogenase (cytochrome)
MTYTAGCLLAAILIAPLTGFAQDAPPPTKSMPNHCASNPGLGDIRSRPAWNGWGAGLANARLQTGPAAQLSAAQVAKLKLKWAFGFPEAKSVVGQPSVVAGRVFLGVDTGLVYSIDAATGCWYWSFRADTRVRSAISIGPGRSPGQYLAYFGDGKATVYAVDAATGVEVWKTRAESHPSAGITGAPALYQNRLYVPVASSEEVAATDPAYQCCTFRGSVSALDAQTGRVIWKTYVIPEAPAPTGKNAKGTQQFAPSGGGVWSSPTIDPERKTIYIGTGDAYSAPAANTSDSVMALDLESGKIKWWVQDLSGDAWVVACIQNVNRENCPQDAGPDHDFGSSPILKSLGKGKSVLIAGQKSGVVWAHDPDRKGAVVWRTPAPSKPPGPGGQIVWGGAADDVAAYFGLDSGGVVSFALANGERRWFTPMDPAAGRHAGDSGAVSAMPGVIFSGGWDGVLRALSAGDGKILWDFDTARDFETVNGVAAKGGSMGSPGPTVAGGMVFVGSGYLGVQNGAPGNVLLAFGE